MEIDLKRYSGKWFEIARIKNTFEPNMTNVTAQYNLNNDDTIQVINSGYINGEFKEIIGHAIKVNEDTLKVSFQPKIYKTYKILAIDKNYQYAMIGNLTKQYIWILSRKPYITKEILNTFLNIAKKQNYDINKLLITK